MLVVSGMAPSGRPTGRAHRAPAAVMGTPGPREEGEEGQMQARKNTIRKFMCRSSGGADTRCMKD